MIAKIAFHYLKNWADAEDITQDVMLKWVKKKPVFSSTENEKAWFIRVTINLCKDRLRSSWLKKIVVTENELWTEPKSETEQSEVLQQVLNLPEKYRIVLYLYYYEGYTLNEIAGILKKNPNTVQTWHQRAKMLLKPKLEGLSNEYGFIQRST